MAFDPLSSQGLLNALYTGPAVSETVDRWLSGERSVIAAYSSELANNISNHYARNLAARMPKSSAGRTRDSGSATEGLSVLPHPFSPVIAIFSMIRRRRIRKMISIGSVLIVDPAHQLPIVGAEPKLERRQPHLRVEQKLVVRHQQRPDECRPAPG